DEYFCVAIDLPGHGQSPLTPFDSWERAVDGIVSVAEQLGIEKFHLVGYSMGARFAMAVMAYACERLASSVLISGFPGYKRELARIQRREVDERLAEHIKVYGLDAFMDAWYQMGMFRSLHWHPGLLERLRARRIHRDQNAVAEALSIFSPGNMPFWGDLLADAQVSVMYMAGEIDDKYCGILQQLMADFSHIHGLIIPACSHAIHLERPDIVAEEIAHWVTGILFWELWHFELEDELLVEVEDELQSKEILPARR
ncbi:MAG: alpha/beta fold hydrolase, partial [Lentisphaerae bacterium]